MQKMWKNAKKAIEEHEGKEEIYASPEESLPPMALLVDAAPLTPLQLIHHVAEAQGVRDTMEDAHFFKEIEQGTITGILDGHGGSAVATHASTLFQEKFSAALTKAQGNVHEAFETVIHEIHEDIASHRNWDKIGSTAVLSFIDKNTHLIYTATLGDSEANVYRKIDGELKSIPLSCVRDWSSRKDAQRAAIALNRPKIAKQWPLIHPKVLRFPSSRYGVNVSRAFGDVDLTGTVEHPGVIHKPKITVNQLKPGDTLILACDGLKDYVSETTIAALLALPFPEEDTSTIAAALLVNYALLSSRDNISVMAIKVT
jgi:serine/threonine protein phosphatase PrpC